MVRDRRGFWELWSCGVREVGERWGEGERS